MPVYGLTSGMLPIMSYNLGAKRRERIWDTLRSGLLYTAILMFAGTVGFQLAPRKLLWLFGASEEMLSIGIPALRVISSSFFFEGFCLISQTGFQAVGRGMTSLMCSLTRQIFLLMPLAYVLSLGGDLHLVWLAYPITGILSLVMSLFLWKAVCGKNRTPTV